MEERKALLIYACFTIAPPASKCGSSVWVRSWMWHSLTYPLGIQLHSTFTHGFLFPPAFCTFSLGTWMPSGNVPINRSSLSSLLSSLTRLWCGGHSRDSSGLGAGWLISEVHTAGLNNNQGMGKGFPEKADQYVNWCTKWERFIPSVGRHYPMDWRTWTKRKDYKNLWEMWQSLSCSWSWAILSGSWTEEW